MAFFLKSRPYKYRHHYYIKLFPKILSSHWLINDCKESEENKMSEENEESDEHRYSEQSRKSATTNVTQSSITVV